MDANFQNKFKNQMQSMGKGGIAGTMNANSIPLNQFQNIGMPEAVTKVKTDSVNSKKVTPLSKIPKPAKNSSKSLSKLKS